MSEPPPSQNSPPHLTKEFIPTAATKLELFTKASINGVVKVAIVVGVTAFAIFVAKRGSFWGRPSSEDTENDQRSDDPVPGLYQEGVDAYSRYHAGKRGNATDLTEAIDKCDRALSYAPKGHSHRNHILSMLAFAKLDDIEHGGNQVSLQKIEEYFSELEDWEDLQRDDARAIVARLAEAYRNLHRQTPSSPDFERSLSYYNKAKKYIDDPGHDTAVDLDIVGLYRQAGQLESAMKILEGARSTCPNDRPELLSWISRTKYELHREIFESTGSNDFGELKKAIAAGEGALRMEMEPIERMMVLVGVTECIYVLSENRYEVELEGRMRDAIKYGREALNLDTANEGTRAQACIALADVLSSRRSQPTIEELDEAIGLYRRAKETSGKDPELLASLAGAICFRCESGGAVVEDETTVQSAITLYEAALATPGHGGWKSRIANNVACIFVEKANGTKAEVDYEKAREYYLKAAKYLEAVEGDANDIMYYKDQADTVTETITMLREGGKGGSIQERKLTSRKRPTARGSL